MLVLAERFLNNEYFPMMDSPRAPKCSMGAELLPSVSETPGAMAFLTTLLERIHRYVSVVKALLVRTGYSG
jgi:hypothetical protein